MVPSLMELRVKQGLEPETDDHKGLMKELQLSGLYRQEDRSQADLRMAHWSEVGKRGEGGS